MSFQARYEILSIQDESADRQHAEDVMVAYLRCVEPRVTIEGHILNRTTVPTYDSIRIYLRVANEVEAEEHLARFNNLTGVPGHLATRLADHA